MVSNANQTTLDSPVNQGVHADTSEPNKIGASTPYDFAARNLTAYGGLLPVATMLEKLGFQQLVEETFTVRPAVFWRCVMKSRQRSRTPNSPSSINCSTTGVPGPRTSS